MSDSHKTFDDDRPLPGWDNGSDRPPPWRGAGSTVTFENPWLRLTRHDATAPTGVKADYVVMRPRNLSVGVLPVHEDGTVTLVGQQRFALMNWSWEMPEGGAPFDEDPIAGAQRELMEEAGLEARMSGLDWMCNCKHNVRRPWAWRNVVFCQVHQQAVGCTLSCLR